ncbi:CBS domain-containing protein [Halomicroarcula limicola]|uniref:CBS domain-containing protein n=1 Tax=Haloarcula limicola TaxID=1429915 RepID=A0A8J8C2W5_9EURY|nr:CBS domain-containing protein [Halomicroarcula limicola]MBV0923622.1 CBS domain-containing protein [Halomicroarcula limicola]
MDDIFVGRLMSSPVQTVSADASAASVAEKMIAENISSVVVVDDAGQLEGIVTSTDFVRIAAQGGETDSIPVSEYMSTDVVTTTANESVESVADTLIANGIHHVPVTDETEGVVGMLTTTDLTAYVSGIEEPSPARAQN